MLALTDLISDTLVDSPSVSGTTTPRLEADTRHVKQASAGVPNAPKLLEQNSNTLRKTATVEYDSDIDPDDLLPVYLEIKTKLFHLQLQSPRLRNPRSNSRATVDKGPTGSPLGDAESAKMMRKVKRIEDDVLFDKYLADKHWEARRIQLERDAAARRSAEEDNQTQSSLQESATLVESDDEVSQEAAKIGAAMLEEEGSDDDAALADLFASLPINEVDPVTGKSSTVVNGSNGVRVVIRDFGKWTGISPTRVLEEACRARYVFSSVGLPLADRI